jgi:hypothetical protein
MNKTITGKEAIELLENASAIIIMDNNSAVTYPLIEQPDNDEFWNVDANYTDEEGLEYEYSFKIWGDDEIEVNNNQLLLLESNGDVVSVVILEHKKL